MSEPSTSTISTKKVTSSVAGYIWDSPCLKPLVFNPFLVSAVILLVIWAIDLLYGKGFKKGGASLLIQHMITTYIVVASGVALNNILIKHRYRLDKNEAKLTQESTPEESTPEEPTFPESNDLVSSYEE